MILLEQTFIQIVSAGGGLVISLEKQMLTVDSMVRIAAAAGHSGASVTFRLGKRVLIPEKMIQIAAAGRGRVIFDIS